MMKKKGGVGFKAVSLNDSFEEEEDLEEEASPFPPPPGTKRNDDCLLYTSPSPRDRQKSRMPSSA